MFDVPDHGTTVSGASSKDAIGLRFNFDATYFSVMAIELINAMLSLSEIMHHD